MLLGVKSFGDHKRGSFLNNRNQVYEILKSDFGDLKDERVMGVSICK
jgi:hypothetical protein